jgi:hypothetical protein
MKIPLYNGVLITPFKEARPVTNPINVAKWEQHERFHHQTTDIFIPARVSKRKFISCIIHHPNERLPED